MSDAEVRTRVRVVRWKAAVPLVVLLILVGVGWVLLLDTVVERSVEKLGTRLVGALVELEYADVRIGDGVVAFRGLQVTNPSAPMTNLFEADEVVLNMRVPPLLEKKLVVDTVAVRGVRFGTPRETSGAVDLSDSPETGLLARQVDQWMESVRVPPLSLEGLTQTVDVTAIDPDSLATLQAARALRAEADSMRSALESRIEGLDPRPVLDTTRALLGRIEGQSIRTLGLGGIRDAVTTGRATLTRLDQLGEGLEQLQASVESGVDSLRSGLETIAALRDEDFRYALGLLNIPSLSAPDLGPSLFGDWAKQRAEPVLYWLRMAEEYLPPGVRRQLRPGPLRARAPGTTVTFPLADDPLPRLLVGLAEATVELSGENPAAGMYAARIVDLTSSPVQLGRPTRIFAERVGGVVGPDAASLFLLLDHTGTVPRDSARATATGLPLPRFALQALGGSVSLGEGAASFSLARDGEELSLGWGLASGSISWAAAEGRQQSRIESILWQSVSRLDSLAVDVRLRGELPNLSLSVSSNLADAVARSLREQLGAEIESARARVRSEVEQRIAGPVGEASSAVTTIETDVRQRVEGLRTELAELRGRLEAEVRRLAGIGGAGL